MNMNFSEYIRCKEIINYILGSIIPNVKSKIENEKLDFITYQFLDEDKT